jgi:hypothetical protein
VRFDVLLGDRESEAGAAALFLAIESPRPVPRLLVVKNGSKMRSRIAAGMPGPLSATSSVTRS